MFSRARSLRRAPREVAVGDAGLSVQSQRGVQRIPWESVGWARRRGGFARPGVKTAAGRRSPASSPALRTLTNSLTWSKSVGQRDAETAAASKIPGRARRCAGRLRFGHARRLHFRGGGCVERAAADGSEIRRDWRSNHHPALRAPNR
jgi:hypothetical protein